MQLTQLFPVFDALHAIHGSKNFTAIYGAGQIRNPQIAIVFMNPTAKNISAALDWQGIKAPWLGTKSVWKLFGQLGLLTDQKLLAKIQAYAPADWTPEFAQQVYQHVADSNVYITNIAKCTQDDARPLTNAVYTEYLPSMLEELEHIDPRIVLTLGNQVSSVLLQKPISVSSYLNTEKEELVTPKGSILEVYPAYYPVGQGTPNIGKTISRVQAILSTLD